MFTAYVYPSGKLAKLTEEEFARHFPNIRRVIVQSLPQEPPMHKLFYFNTGEIPTNVVTSTARLGREWYDQVKVGDTVAIHQVSDKNLVGYSVVVAKEFLSYQAVWENADHNSVGYGKPTEQARALVHQTIVRAFGNQKVSMTSPCFSVLHLLPINNAEDIPNEIADDVIDGVVEEAQVAIAAAEAEVAYLTGTLASQGEQLLESLRARRDLDKTNNLLLGIIAQKVEEQQAKDTEEVAEARETISDIHAMAIGHFVAAKDNGPFVRAVTHIRRAGEAEDTLRVEF